MIDTHQKSDLRRIIKPSSGLSSKAYSGNRTEKADSVVGHLGVRRVPGGKRNSPATGGVPSTSCGTQHVGLSKQAVSIACVFAEAGKETQALLCSATRPELYMPAGRAGLRLVSEHADRPLPPQYDFTV